jgi:hypothetical protein
MATTSTNDSFILHSRFKDHKTCTEKRPMERNVSKQLPTPRSDHTQCHLTSVSSRKVFSTFYSRSLIHSLNNVLKKKWLQALRGSNSLKWAITSQSTHVQKPSPADMGDVRVVSSADAVQYVIPTHFNTTFSSSSHTGVPLCRKFLLSLESPDRHSVLAFSHLTALNTPNSTVKHLKRIKVRG